MTGSLDYELYHDESNRGGYWHGMLLVPVHLKELCLEWLETARQIIGYPHKISFKKINRPGAKYRLANAWLSIAIGFLRTYAKNIHYYAYLGDDEQGKPIHRLMTDELVGARFILFRECDNHTKMQFYSDETSKVETSFRIGLKGGLHFLFSDDSPGNIERLHFDGFQHQGRHIDRERVITRLTGLRQYCTIHSGDDLIDDRSSDPSNENPQDYVDCQLLQLTDLLIGAYRSAFGYYSNDSQRSLARYAHTMIDRYSQGITRMHKSRWVNAFCLSQCYLQDGKWHFETIELHEKAATTQMSLLGGE